MAIHLALVAAAGNELTRAVGGRILWLFSLTSGRDLTVQGEERAAILSALRAGNERPAEALAFAHIEEGRARPRWRRSCGERAVSVHERLRSLGITLPRPPAPTGSFLPFVVTGSLVFLAGQTNEVDGVPTVSGRVPGAVSAAEANEAARTCGLNLLAALSLACDLDDVERCVSVRGFVNADAGFAAVPGVVDGASDLFVAVFGEAGRHARTAIGVATLPKNAAVEVDAVFALRSAHE